MLDDEHGEIRDVPLQNGLGRIRVELFGSAHILKIVVREIRMPLYERLGSGEADAEESARLEKQMDEIRAQMQEADYRFVKENINNPAAWYKLYNVGVTAAMEDDAVAKLKDLIAGAEGSTKERVDYKGIVDRIAVLERTAVGQPFTDLAMEDPDGKRKNIG